MKQLTFALLTLTLASSGCATYRWPQEQTRRYSPATLHYHRVHGQTLRHPNCWR